MPVPYCFLAKLPAGHYVTTHVHHTWEIVYYVEGTGTSQIGDVRHAVAQNTVTVTPAGVSHDQFDETPLTSICIRMADHDIRDLQGCWVDADGALGTLCHQLLLESKRREPFCGDVCLGLVLQLVGLVRRLGARSRCYYSQSRYVREALAIILQREGCVSVQEIADQLHVSPSHLRNVFRKCSHLSPREHILQVRLDKAKALLATSDLSISEIATLCGFSSVYHFSRLFSRTVGTAPSRYRAHNR